WWTERSPSARLVRLRPDRPRAGSSFSGSLAATCAYLGAMAFCHPAPNEAQPPIIMQYGYFDDASNEYVIHRPDTPAPWVNYLGTDQYCAIVSNNASGYGFVKSPKSGRDRRSVV